MAKKQKMPQEDQIRHTAEYYHLHTRAVDDLVGADRSNSPVVSEEERRKYRSGLKLKVPAFLKAFFIKYWLAGATCFFFMWGLGMVNLVDVLVVMTLAGGIVTEFLTNNILRFVARPAGANDRWMMYPKRSRFASLPLNVLHAGVVTFLVYQVYYFINTFLTQAGQLPEGSVPLGVEPLLFGLFYLAVDLALIRMKQVFMSIIRDARKKVDQH